MSNQSGSVAQPHFVVDRKGLAEVARRREDWRAAALFELFQNAVDNAGATEIDIQVLTVTGHQQIELRVTDNHPDGFADLAHAWTLFAPSAKRENPTQRGRFNLGEKVVAAVCEWMTIETTKGTVRFDGDGRRVGRGRRESGSEVRAALRGIRVDLEAVLMAARRLIPPQGVVVRLNGEVLPRRTVIGYVPCALPTDVLVDGVMCRQRRSCMVAALERAGDVAMLYEMGIPVLELPDDRFDLDVAQKVPLNFERDGVPPSYLRTLRVAVANDLVRLLSVADAHRPWVREALASPKASEALVKRAVELRFGEKVVAYDPSDREANRTAVAMGYTVVHGSQLSSAEWENVRRFGAAPPAGKVAPSMKVYGDGPPTPQIPVEEWTLGMRIVAAYARRLALAFHADSRPIQVVMEDARGAGWAANYGIHAPAKVLERGVAEDPAELVNARCQGRRAVIFAATAAHALDIARRIPGAETVLDSTPKAIRSTVRDRLATGETQHLVTVRALCLDAETEILTSDGWAGIDSMTSAHRVANWEGGRVTFEPPAEVIRRERAPGERMVSMDGRRFNLRVTEGHGLLYRTLQGGRFHKKPARELVGKKIELPVAGRAEAERMEPSDGPRPAASRARIISANAYHLRKLEGYDHAASLVEAARRADHRASLRRKRPDELTTDECSLIGFWLGDGWRADLASGGVSYCAVQSFANQPIIDWFDGVVARTGLFCVTSTLPPATKTLHPAKQWRFSRGTGGGSQERKGVYALEPYLAKDGSPLFWGLNDDQFAALIHGFWMADGNHLDGVRIPNRGFDFHNTNKSLLDLLQAIGSVRGYTANLRLSRPSTPKYSPLYSLHLAKRDHVYMGATSRLRFEPDWKAERVWCVRTRAGNIITRRAGKVVVMGNCEGFDAPVLDTVVLCGAFTTVTPYLQAIGRGLRAYTCPITGRRKVDCHVYDLRGAVHLHGLPDDARRWSLEGAQGRSMVERPKPLRRCEACHHLFAPRTVCPACGSVHHSPVPMLRIQRAALFAASSIPIGARVQQWVDGAVRAITAKRPDISPAWARAAVLKKPPSWVREYLENQSVSQAASQTAGDVHAS